MEENYDTIELLQLLYTYTTQFLQIKLINVKGWKEGYIYTDFLVDLLYNFNAISQKALSKIYLMAL